MTPLLLALHLVVGAVPGTVEGRVLSAATAETIPDARVTLLEAERTVRTDVEGRFVLSDLAEGRWRVRVRAPGFLERDVVLRVPAEGTVHVEIELRPVPGPAPEPETPGTTVRGTVREEETGRPVPEASVVLAEPGARGFTTRTGSFVLRDVPPGDWTLAVEGNGYRTLRRPLTVGPDGVTGLDLRLEPDPVPLPGLRVFRGRIEDLARIDAPSARVMDSTRVDLLPVAVERDVFRALQTLPSVTPLSDYSSALWVRGGTPDQTRIHLDGIPLHNPYHVGGFFSTFTDGATEAAVLRAGGLPASAPSSLSGMAEMYTRAPGRDSVRTRGGLGLISSSATVDGPLAGGRGGWLLSGRRTYLDLASRGAASLGLVKDPIPYGFGDVLGRAEYDLGDALTLSSTAYLNREGLGDIEGDADLTSDAGWGSDAVGVRLTGILGGWVLTDVGVSTSGFGGDFFRSSRSLPPGGEPTVDSTGVRMDLRTWAFHGTARVQSAGHLVQAGVRWERSEIDHRIRADASTQDVLPSMDLAGRWGSAAVFLRDRWSAGGWTVDVGLRGERPEGRGWEALPRGRLERAVGEHGSVALAGGRYVQEWWGLRNPESALSDAVGYDLLAPVPEGRPLPTGWDAVAEIRGRVAGVDLRLDAFLKELRDVPAPLPSIDPLDEPVVLRPDAVPLGEASVRGLELSAEGRLGGASLAVSYRWQDEERRSLGRSFTPRSERPHRVTLSGTHPWGERELAFALTWMSGTPFTPIESLVPRVGGVHADGRTYGGFGEVLVFGEPNGARVRPYLRLDVSGRGAWDMEIFGRRGVLEPYLSILNVFNRHNGFVVEHQLQGGFGGPLRTVQKVGPQFPVLPSFGVRWRF